MIIMHNNFNNIKYSYKDFIKYLKNIDKKILKISKKILTFTFILMLISILILTLYCTYDIPDTYYIGMELLKSSIFLSIITIIYMICFNKLIKP